MNDMQDTQTSNQSATAANAEDPPTAQAEHSDTGPDDLAPALAAMIASIRSALVPSASPQARTDGASACRSILTVLEAKPGQPLTDTPPAPAQPQSPLASLLSQPGLLAQLAAMSREQLVDFVKKVTGAASPQPQSRTIGGPRFHLLQIPQVRRPGGGS